MLLSAHDLFGKPLHTFPDHAPDHGRLLEPREQGVFTIIDLAKARDPGPMQAME
jgi:hypothetical protein